MYPKLYNMRTELLQIRIEPELLQQLKELSESNSLPVSAQVRMLIKKEVRGQ